MTQRPVQPSPDALDLSIVEFSKQQSTLNGSQSKKPYSFLFFMNFLTTVPYAAVPSSTSEFLASRSFLDGLFPGEFQKVMGYRLPQAGLVIAKVRPSHFEF